MEIERTVLPDGIPGHSNKSDEAAKSVIISRNDNDPRIITTILAVLWSTITQNGICKISKSEYLMLNEYGKSII